MRLKPSANGLIWLAALSLGLWVFGQALPRLSGSLLGIEEVDHYGTQWFYWFVGHQLEQGTGVGDTDLFFFPWGKDVFLHTGANVLDAWLALPVRRLLGPVAGYNAFLLAGLAFNGWAFARLAREWVDDAQAVAVAAVLFAFAPYVLYEAAEGRPTQAIVGLLPLFLLQLWRVGTGRGLKPVLLGALLLAVLGYQYWFYAFFAGLSALGLGLWRTLRPPAGAGGRAAILARHAALAGVAVLLCAPGAWALASLSAGADSTVPGLLDTAAWTLSELEPVTREGHAVALLTWQPLHLDSGFFVRQDDGDWFLPHQHTTTWAGTLMVLLFLLRRREPLRAPWLALVAGAAIIATGPLVLVGSTWVPDPLYIGLSKTLGFLRRLWWPGRAYAVLLVLGCLATAVVLARLPRRPRLAVGGLLFFAQGLHLSRAGLAPFPTWSAEVPAGYHCLAEGPPGAVIELPYGWTQAHLYYQTVHARPILGGMLERNPVFSPPEAVSFREDNSFVAALIATASVGEAGSWTEEDRQAAFDVGYRYVVWQKDALALLDSYEGMAATARRTRLRRIRSRLLQLVGTPVWEDSRVAIFAPWTSESPCAEAPVKADEQPPVRRDRNGTSSVLAIPGFHVTPAI